MIYQYRYLNNIINIDIIIMINNIIINQYIYLNNK